MIYGSVCSGIEAATVAWHPLGWTPRWFAEIDPAPSRVLAHHYPDVPNLGDFTTIEASHGAVDLLVGGTPCQAFSIAGLRGGLADARGNLTLEFCRLAARLRPRWLVWENVPGVLSADGGRAFGSFLGALAELGYGFAWRVLDAQFFGVPQRRRRVFVVACAGADWRRAAEVLFERPGGGGDSAAGGEAGEAAAARAGSRAGALCAQMGRGLTHQEAVGTGLVVEPIAFDTTQITSATNRCQPKAGAPCHPLAASAHPPSIASAGLVRRLTPRECERLQGFPDDYTAILSDSARYKALGNSMAVPVMRWIGERIAAREANP